MLYFFPHKNIKIMEGELNQKLKKGTRFFFFLLLWQKKFHFFVCFFEHGFRSKVWFLVSASASSCARSASSTATTPLGPCGLTCCRNHVAEGTPFPYKGEALFPVCQPYHDPLSSAHLGWLSNWTPTTFARWAAVAMIALLPPGDDRGPPVAGAGWVSITLYESL